MANESSAIVQKLWNYCHVLRDDGVSYGDYVEQLTYLLFLKMAAHDYLSHTYQLDKKQKQFLRFGTFKGKDIVDGVVRLCVMNLFLHGIGGDEVPVKSGDSLISDPGDRFEVVMTNPPFGKKSSITIVNGEGKADRQALSYELEDFIKCYNPKNRRKRQEAERFRAFTYEDLMQRDKVSLDIFWLKDDSLEDSEHLPAPEVLALDITENLEAALEQFSSIYEDLQE